MPRGPRLDAPGVLHHVMARGIGGVLVFPTDPDREDFLRRLASQAAASRLQIIAWALLPNHLHLLLRTGLRPLSSVMRRVLTGYAGAFNRRHKRHGHLFENRFKSIVVEEEAYLLELTRYIHLNPLRAGLVPNLAALDRYPWCGHSALLGRVPRSWQAVDEVLGQFAATSWQARRRYRAFVAEGARQGRRPELQGGGLRRSAGGWESLNRLRRGREGWAFDERVLGSGPFVEHVLREMEPRVHPGAGARGERCLPTLITRMATVFGVGAAEIIHGSRRRPVAHARAAVSAVAVTGLGLAASRVAEALGMTGMVVLRGVDRGLQYLRESHLDPHQLAKAILKKV